MNGLPKNVYVVIMAGGSGTRFWPRSTAKKPKQLLSFGHEKDSLLQKTIQRLDVWSSIPTNQKIVLTTQSLEKSVFEQIKGMAEVWAEPEGRNTAPCLFWAAQEIHRRDPEAIMLVLPADHFIRDTQAFQTALQEAVKWAESESVLLTLGVKPTRPETGFGYLKLKSGMKIQNGSRAEVERFVEKPDLEKAKQFLENGSYLWNGGMFAWKVKTVLAAFSEHMPEYQKIWDLNSGDVKKTYSQLETKSIDYAVMEKARNVRTVVLDCGWDDLGSWTSMETLSQYYEAICEGGVCFSGKVIAADASGNIVDAPGKLVTLFGVHDLVVVEHEGKILIADKAKSQNLSVLLQEIKKKAPEAL